MSVSSTLAAWDAWLGAQAAPLSTPVRYKHAQPWPYQGTYPFVVMLPHTQRRERYSNAEVVWLGLYRLLYVDAVAASVGSPSAVLLAAGDWCEAVVAALQSSDANRSLAGAVDYVGESPDGGAGGITIDWDGKISAVDQDNRLVWGVPLDIFVRERPTTG